MLRAVKRSLSRITGRVVHSQYQLAPLSSFYTEGWDRVSPVFILTTDRTGTATLATLIAGSKHFISRHEPKPILIKTPFDCYMDSHENKHASLWPYLVHTARDEFVYEVYKNILQPTIA